MSELDQIVSTVASSKKYGAVCADTVRRIAARELGRHGDPKKATKATKRRLHQVYGAFEGSLDYDAAARHLEAAYGTGSNAEIESACRKILGLHSSTRERLPILNHFYPAILAITGQPRSILDLGCGLNPLAQPWMGLEAGVRYMALDIDADRARFLDRYLTLAGMDGSARCRDILARPLTETEIAASRPGPSVALLLKMSPTLERQEKGSTLRLLEQLDTQFIVVSFAVKSLGGRKKGMAGHYDQQFQEMLVGRRWAVDRLEFSSELVFVVEREA
jgi:16S rRNA (guanine(1405)-N(7))-methyltransferase